jgi:hypothetical protein
MRNAIYAAFLFACASTAALGQANAQRPANPAPAATAAFEIREAWCLKYSQWFVMQAPSREPVPAGARPTQRLENELTYCKLDPQQYERETLAELHTLQPRVS